MKCKYINNLKVINPKVSKKKLYIYIHNKKNSNCISNI